MPLSVVEKGDVVAESGSIYEINKYGGSFLVEEIKVAVADEKGEEKREKDCLSRCSSSTSSIGKNSDVSGNSLEISEDSEEVQSSYKGSLDAMEALEEVLPIRRGISTFYNGKSKSFASLADASSSSSIKDLAKQENAYMRKRRNLLACGLAWDKNRSFPLSCNGGGISKRVTNSTRTTLALAAALNCCSSKTADRKNSIRGLISGSSPLDSQFQSFNQCNESTALPVRQNFVAWRSFSLADLQQCVSITVTPASPAQFEMKPT